VSDIKKKRLYRLMLYMGATLFCIVFSQVYGLFSHGVTSLFMSGLFVPPLFGGLVEGALLLFLRLRFRRSADNLFHAGIGTLTVGSLLQGIFEIAGTGSPYIYVFPVAGGLLLAGAAVCFLLPGEKRKEIPDETSSR